VGARAQRSIEQQVRAAGRNQLTIRAGNWKPEQEEPGDAVAHQGDAGDSPVLHVPELLLPPPASYRPPPTSQPDAVPAAFHPESGPMEKHDHPLARQRLGDLEAGLGSAATLSFDDVEAIREMDGVQYVAGGVHENARVHFGDKRWFTRMHGTDVQMPSIKRAWTFQSGRFFTEREQERAEQVLVLGQVVAEKLFGDAAGAVGREVTLWNPPFEGVGVITSAT